MDSPFRLVKEYTAPNGKNLFREWLDSLKDETARSIIDIRINYLRRGGVGDCRFVGHGIRELKIHYGPGYRIYFGQVRKAVILLLYGGIKKTQQADIEKASIYFEEYKRKI